MDNSLQSYENTIAAREETAAELDIKIKTYTNIAWLNLIEACKCLKRMRDTKKYEELGYATFGEYTEASLNIKERQAYTYISTYEKQGEAFLQSNAELGITKLALLNAIPVTEREEFVETHDLAGMSVADVEKLVKENDGRAEQINLLNDEISAKDEEIIEAEQRIRELETELEEANNRPVEVAVAEPDKETLDKIRIEAAKEAKKSFAAEKKKLTNNFNIEKDKAVAEIADKANKEIAELKEQLSIANAAADEAAQRADDLEKKLAISSSPEATKFTFYFDAINEDYNKIIESINNLKKESPEIADKYAKAMGRYQNVIKERFAAIGYEFDSGGDDSGTNTVTVKKYPDSEDTGYCSNCNSCCALVDNFCSFCGGKIVRDEQ